MPPAARRWFDLSVVESTKSTNTDLLRDADRLPSGTVLAAEVQTAGRGRRGRAWIAPPGGSLAFSVLWKFDGSVAALSGLSPAVGVAVARALEAQGAQGVCLKWPNDLLAQHAGVWRKLGGILIDVSGASAGTVAAVIGIGLNVKLGPAAAQIDQPVTDTHTLNSNATRDALLAAVLTELAVVLPLFARSGFAPLVDEWNQRHAWHGLPVRMAVGSDSGDAAAGIASGVADDGALLIETPAGVTRVLSGDVLLRVVSR